MRPPANAVAASLTGPHAHLAEVKGRAARYQVDVAPFATIVGEPDDGAWADLADLLGPGVTSPLAGVEEAPPEDWEIVAEFDGVQMIGEAVQGGLDPQTRVLGPADVPAMLDLVARTEPGPFRPRTIEMGTYLGIHEDGKLVGMAGERMRPAGWTEISAVCTDEDYRGRGLATRLVLAVVAGIRARGDVPFLHATATNTNAIRLYRALGFELVKHTTFRVATTPAA
jgi:ribosomal protein S18 acetylase RimI-like enzyme